MSAACCSEGRGGVYICSAAATGAPSGVCLIISSQLWINPVQLYCLCVSALLWFYSPPSLFVSKEPRAAAADHHLSAPLSACRQGRTGRSVTTTAPPLPSSTSKRIFVSECGALTALLPASTQRTLRRSTSSSVKSLSWTTWPASCWFIPHVCCTSLR